MNFEKLLEDKKIEKVAKEEFDLALAEKDILSAKNNFTSEDYEWALTIAYTAVLRAGRSLMSYLGYRTIGKEHHKHVFEFLIESGFDEELVNYFDIIRKKRNTFLYQKPIPISKDNSEEIILNAEDFVHKMRTFVHKIRTTEENNKLK